MPRPSTALVLFDIPGRRYGGVRVNSPSKNQSFRILYTDDEGRPRERTKVGKDRAVAEAEVIARDLAARQHTFRVNNPNLADIMAYYAEGPGRPKRWTSEKSARRPKAIARRIFTAQDLNRPAADYCGADGPQLLQTILDRAARAGCAPGSSEYAKAGGLLKTLFDVAARDNLVALPYGNPAQHLRYRLHEFHASPDPQLLTVNYVGPELRPSTDRVLEFIEATREMFGDREALYIQVLAFAGLRPGEANALTHAQLRGDHPGIRVDHQVLELTAGEARASGGSTQQFRPPKWGQIRNAFCPDPVLDALRELPPVHTPGIPTQVLFPSRQGGLRWQSNWKRDVFTQVAQRVDWPYNTVQMRGRAERHWVWPAYGFRHHYANYLLKDLQMPLVAVARFMGHRDVRVTERMYLKTELADLDVAQRAYDAWAMARRSA